MQVDMGHEDGSGRGCPPWCRRPHGALDHGDDALHQSDPVFVAVVTGEPRFTSGPAPFAEDLVIRVIQRPGSSTAWLEVAAEEGREAHLLLTGDSARRLAGALAAVLTGL